MSGICLADVFVFSQWYRNAFFTNLVHPYLYFCIVNTQLGQHTYYDFFSDILFKFGLPDPNNVTFSHLVTELFMNSGNFSRGTLTIFRTMPN